MVEPWVGDLWSPSVPQNIVLHALNTRMFSHFWAKRWLVVFHLCQESKQTKILSSASSKYHTGLFYYPRQKPNLLIALQFCHLTSNKESTIASFSSSTASSRLLRLPSSFSSFIYLTEAYWQRQRQAWVGFPQLKILILLSLNFLIFSPRATTPSWCNQRFWR